jgi:hypothetical protein
LSLLAGVSVVERLLSQTLKMNAFTEHGTVPAG